MQADIGAGYQGECVGACHCRLHSQGDEGPARDAGSGSTSAGNVTALQAALAFDPMCSLSRLISCRLQASIGYHLVLTKHPAESARHSCDHTHTIPSSVHSLMLGRAAHTTCVECSAPLAAAV